MQIKFIILPSGKELVFLKKRVFFGRSGRNDVIINNSVVSRKHCVVLSNGFSYKLKDLDSTNGTYVNGLLLKDDIILQNRDTINLGYKGPLFQFKIIPNTPVDYIILFLRKFKYYKITLFLILVLFLMIRGGINHKYTIQNNINNVKKDTDLLKNEFRNLLYEYGITNFALEEKVTEKIRIYVKNYKTSKTYYVGLQNRKKYLPMITKIFNKYKIPLDFSFLAFVESNYNPKAYNKSSGARGLWQLMASTARQYGLIVNRKFDERINSEKSTVAAAKYINDLLSVFGLNSFMLVIAAYNVGDGSLRISLRQINDPLKERSFSYLFENDLLPKETKEFVLKVLALILLSKNPDIV